MLFRVGQTAVAKQWDTLAEISSPLEEGAQYCCRRTPLCNFNQTLRKLRSFQRSGCNF